MIKSFSRFAKSASEVALAFVICSSAALAQNQFAPAIKVNDRVITGYELDQRARFLQVLNAPGNPADLAREQLIDDRLKQDALATAGITPNREQVLEGMAEFAGRGGLTLEQFITAIAQDGVDQQSFRSFVEVGIGWREFVRARFATRAAVSDTEIERRIALSSANKAGGVRVLLSEIVLANLPEVAEETRARAEEIAQVQSIAQFAALARQYSLSNSRENSGRLNWRALSDFPPAIAQRFLSLQRGAVTQPISSGEAVVLFQLRGIEETSAPSPAPATIDYAAYYIAGGRSEAGLKRAAEIRASVDTCDDLYGIAQGQPARVLDRGALAPSDIPNDIALELAKLDENEVSTALTRAGGDTLVFLMLCGRTPQLGEDIDRGAIRTSLLNERVERLAEGFLAELRADAIITDQ